METKYVEGSMESDLVPTPVEYAVLRPDNVEALPTLLFLHGGGGSREFLKNMRPLVEECWRARLLPPMLLATPSAGRSFYMDYKDGSQRWESFVLGPFRQHLADAYGGRPDREGTFALGISMGGLGVLRLGFKRPDAFAAVAALEPGIDPAFEWREVQPRHRFWRGPTLLESIFGSPFDEAYWNENNPASIAAANAERIRASGLQVYIECGDEDFFNLHEATEFLHRVLWDNAIPHEYHLVRGANHVGRTLPGRFREAFEFVERVLNPPGPDPAVADLEARLGDLKERFS